MPSRKTKAVIEYRNYYLPSDFPVLLLTGEIWKISDAPAENLHFHNCLEIGICHSSCGVMQFYDEQTVPFEAGDITCIPRNIPHTTCSAPSQKSQWSYLFFDPGQLFRDKLPGNSLSPLPQENVQNYLVPAKTSPRISFLAQAVIEELSVKSIDYPLARSYLFTLYTEITKFQEQRRSENPPRTSGAAFSDTAALSIWPALDYMEDHYMNKFPIEHLAQLCHLSPTHFRRIFHSIMQVSPLAYLNTIRLTNACNLLCDTNLSILSIAEMTGFSTLCNFNRHFNRVMNTSPREYRKKMRLGKQEGGTPAVVEYSGWMEP